jgi:GT2 family glycosyltransferase
MNSPTNLGCARAWNAGLETVFTNSPESYVLVVNDDITLHPDCIELFDKATKERSDSIIFCAGGVDSPNAFSLFCTRYDKLKDSVGLFDEMFLYPYCEDGDMARRLMFYGQELDRVEGASADHIGSATLKAFNEQEQENHHIRFKRNAEYFKLKWGIDHNNIYSKDGYILPFDGSDAEEIMAKSYMTYAYGA